MVGLKNGQMRQNLIKKKRWTPNIYLGTQKKKTTEQAAMLTWKLPTKLASSSSHSMLTQGQPVLVLTLQCEVSGSVAARVPVYKSLVWLGTAGSMPPISRMQGRHLTTWDRQTESDRVRQTDRQTETQRQRQRERGRERERKKERKKERERERKRESHTNRNG